MNEQIGDLLELRNARFSANVHFAAEITILALHQLKTLSRTLGIPIEDISARHIIDEFSHADVQIRQFEEQFSSFRSSNEK